MPDVHLPVATFKIGAFGVKKPPKPPKEPEKPAPEKKEK